MMVVDEPIRAMVLERASSGEIRRQAARAGMKSLREDGRRLVRDGKTTLGEVLRVTKDERANGVEGGEPATGAGQATPPPAG